jgi:tetratricopeptide (TPR) repeat protein
MAFGSWYRTRAALGLWLLLQLFGCAFSHPDPVGQARLLVDKGRPGEAAAALEAELAKRPNALPERRLLIRVLALMGRMDRAEEQARVLAGQLGATSPIPWIELGHALELAHRYDEALEQYDHAAQVAPRDPVGPRTGGLRAAHWGEAELAEPRLVEALRREPRNPEVWHALGMARARLGNLDGAADAYQSGLRADPSALENRVGLATLAVVRGDAAATLREYDAIVSLRPKFGDAQLGRSWALLKLGRLDDAQRALDRAAELGADPRALAAQRRALSALRSMH